MEQPAAAAPPEAPRFSKEVILKDGTLVRLRPITPADDRRMINLFYRLSPRTVYRRFMSQTQQMNETEVRRYTHIDYDNEMALVAVVHDPEEPDEQRIIGVGRYVRLPLASHAEVAFTVDDAFQGRGLGTHLLQELLPFARMAGVEVLEAEVLAENRQMLSVFRDMGFEVSSSVYENAVHIEFALAETELSEEQRWAREQRANTASIERLFRPRAVAVIGASNRPGTIGHALVRNLVHTEFAGRVYPVNPRYEVVASVPCFPTMDAVPGPVDLAVIAVPAAQVAEVVQACAAVHVYAVVIISAGFSETGPEGKARQDEVMRIARQHGMRVVGPNCLGMLNTEPAVQLNASFAPTFPPAGRVALASQSGALGIAMLNLAGELNLGISQFVGMGNKADISGNDLLYFWGRDPGTQVILLYLESFGNPKKFGRIARRISREKPIVVLKSGTSQAGQRAASSHTGALASSTAVTETLLRQAGITQTHTMQEFFQVAKVLGGQPLPAGKRIAILTNAGGPGILSADRAEEEGLEVAHLSDTLQARLRENLPAAASAGNPVDMIASATPEQYEHCLDLLLSSEEVDLIVVMFIPPLVTRVDDVANAVVQARQRHPDSKPLVACLMGEEGGAPALAALEDAGIATFRFPEEAIMALGKLARYAEWRHAPRGDVVHFPDVDADTVHEIILRYAGEDRAGEERPAADGPQGGAAAHREPVWLPPQEAYRLLGAYGLPVVDTRFATTAREAAEGADELGFPVAMKLASGTIQHKSDVGGVVLGLGSAREVRGAFAELEDNLERLGRRQEMDGVLLQRMAPEGLEMVLGVHADAALGPVMMLGLGGVYLELFKDVQFALHPVTDADVAQMLERLQSRPLLRGYRGEPARDVQALTEAMLRLSQLVEAHPQVRELDLNPIRVLPEGQGCRIVDARIRCAPVDPFTEYVISQMDA